MRLWASELFEYLPKGQLLSQKRECDLIFKDYLNGKQTNHILINYIWQYDIDHLVKYYILLEREFSRRGFSFKRNYVDTVIFEIQCAKGKLVLPEVPFPMHHDKIYLLTCFWNLREKFYGHQKDFSKQEYDNLFAYVNKSTDLLLSRTEMHLN